MNGIIVMAVCAMVELVLFSILAIISIKDITYVQEWTNKADVEIEALKGRNLDLEKRVKELEKEVQK